MATVTLVAHDESEPSAPITTVDLIRPREPFDHPLQLAALVEPPDVFGAADVLASDENPRQRRAAPAAEDRAELVAEPIVDRHVALVDGDAEVPEDRLDGAAVVEGAADDAEAGEVDDDAAVEARRQCSLRRRGEGGA